MLTEIKRIKTTLNWGEPLRYTKNIIYHMRVKGEYQHLCLICVRFMSDVVGIYQVKYA